MSAPVTSARRGSNQARAPIRSTCSHALATMEAGSSRTPTGSSPGSSPDRVLRLHRPQLTAVAVPLFDAALGVPAVAAHVELAPGAGRRAPRRAGGPRRPRGRPHLFAARVLRPYRQCQHRCPLTVSQRVPGRRSTRTSPGRSGGHARGGRRDRGHATVEHLADPLEQRRLRERLLHQRHARVEGAPRGEYRLGVPGHVQHP
jgi:hypothetical protein